MQWDLELPRLSVLEGSPGGKSMVAIKEATSFSVAPATAVVVEVSFGAIERKVGGPSSQDHGGRWQQALGFVFAFRRVAGVC